MASTRLSTQAPKSNLGNIGHYATFNLAARAESWAFPMSNRKQIKTKTARVDSYMIDFDGMKDWLLERFENMSAAEIGLKEVRLGDENNNTIYVTLILGLGG
jgi:hypothetical protein